MSPTIESLNKRLKKNFNKFTDYRIPAKITYDLPSILQDVFQCFLLNYRSLNQYQKHKQIVSESELLSSCNIGSTQLREVLDNVRREDFACLFNSLFSRLQRGKYLRRFEILERNNYLLSLDGTAYHSSKKIHCPNCLIKSGGNYQHQVLQGHVVHPNMGDIVLPILSEEISNHDGFSKQDCELKAGYRYLDKLRKYHPKLKLTIIADGLYSKSPFIKKLRSHGFNYILGAKPKDHTYLNDFIRYGDFGKQLEVRLKDKTCRYKFYNQVPLNESSSIEVNYFTYEEISKEGDIIYKNSWVTNYEITGDNVKELVIAARTRWKSENEGFNIAKHHGYNIEHNYGHGKKNLSYNLYQMNMVSFFVHQIEELCSQTYRNVCKKWSNKQVVWEKVKRYLEIGSFRSWEELLKLILNPRKTQISLPP
jgi:hypothetical protein